MNSRRGRASPACAEEETWTTIITTNTQTVREPEQANPEAGLAPAGHPPARDGVVPPLQDRILKATRQAAAGPRIKGSTAGTSAARHLPTTMLRKGNIVDTSAAQRPSAAAIPRGNIAAMNAAARRQAGAALRKDNMPDTNAALLPAEAAPPLPPGLRPPPALAGAGDMVPPAAVPARQRNGRKNVVTVSAFNRERFLFSRLCWSSSR